MGSTRSKVKTELNYRKGPTWKNCGDCNHFIRKFQVCGIGGVHLRTEGRCKIIGLDSSVKYRIRPDHICDRHDNSEALNRLRNI